MERDRSAENEPVIRPIFTRTIDLGHVLQAVVIAAGAVIYITTVGNTVSQANQSIADLKLQVAELQQQMTSGFQNVQKQIATLPDYGARIGALERRMDAMDQGDAARDARIESVDQEMLRTSAVVSAIEHASDVPLEGRKR
jgi:chromosome segregation ATPase